MSFATPSRGAERIYLLEQQVQGPAPYSLRTLGEIEGARRAAVPETGGHVLVLTSLGRVWGWGQNLYGQLGTGDRAARAGFIEVPGLSDATAIAAGAQHSVALKSDGTVWTWGANSEGQLGDGSLVNHMRPGIVPGLRDVSMVAAGALFTVVLKSDGTVWVFGSNWSGIAGSDARKLVTEPVRVEGLSDVRAVTTRRGVGYALDGQGRIWVWGRGVENAAGTPRVLGEEERPAELGLEFTGPRLSAEWLDAMGEVAVTDHQLRLTSNGNLRTFEFAGAALDVATGWAVVTVAASAQPGLGEAGQGNKQTRNTTGAIPTMGAIPPRGALTIPSAPSPSMRLAGNGQLAMVVRPDGSVRAWGFNDSGRLGDGTTITRPVPVCIGLSNVTAVSVGDFHSLAIRADSTVWSWGLGKDGTLGDDITTDHMRLTPRIVPGLSNVVAVGAGAYHSLALKSDGTVWVWGSNSDGQLGIPSVFRNTGHPQQVPGLTGIVAIAAGNSHNLALRSDGAVFAWGMNYFGQLGDGTTVSKSAPFQIPAFTAVAVAAGTGHSAAIRSDGTLWGWGDNYYMQLGSSFGATELSPVKLASFTDVVQISCEFFTVALRADGSVWAWDAWFGSGVNVNAPSGVAAVAASAFEIEVLLNDSSVQAIYAGTAELVTRDLSDTCSETAPIPVNLGQRIAAGTGHTAVLRSDGTVWAAGNNGSGQIGDGTIVNRTSAVPVPGLSGITALSGDFSHNLAAGPLGRVQAWGLNTNGSIGDQTTVNKLSPAYVNGLILATRVAAGATHSLASRSDGSVWVWGDNTYRQLGNNMQYLLSPWLVDGLQNVVDVAAGNGFSVVLKDDGTVWTWGRNDKGQLGDGSRVQRFAPAAVEGLTNIIAISSGDAFSLALDREGRVWTWGESGAGQLGAGVPMSPVLGIARANSLTGVVGISAGDRHAMAVRSDGTVWTWGDNAQAQLGLPASSPSFQPVQVAGLYGVAGVSAGGQHSLAWKRDGSLLAWGSNQSGQFGLAQPLSSGTPILSGFQPGFPMGTTPLSAVPVSGDSSVQSFDFGFRSAAGASTLRWAQMLFAAEWDGGGLPFCYLHYDVPGNGLWLYGESGYFVGPVAPGTASNLLQNSFCAVDPKKTTLTKNGATLTVRAQVLFKQAASRKIFTRSLDQNDVDSGWIQEGTWDSTAVVMSAPSVTPNAGSGPAPTFVATFTDGSGLPLSTGGWVQFLVAAAADGGGQPFCYLHYDRAGDGLWMYSGDVGFFLGPVKPGVSSTVLQSSACSINTAGTTVQNNAGQLVISSPFTLKSPMTGSKKLFQRSMDALRRDSGWVQTGSWVVP
ncbi:MAG: hypothetical protein J0H49_25530 [Acidobacteria bacterium]|nr:hypothetical protein [Acidobacteriota bacterium]